MKIKLDEYERSILIPALIELRNKMIEEGRYTDVLDELILKLY